MDSASSSKIPDNPDESKEGIINEETMQGQEDISDLEILHQRRLEMQQELIELHKKERKRKESSFTAENSSMEETTSMPRTFDKKGNHHHFQGPWPHQLHLIHKYQILYPSGLIFMHRLQAHCNKKSHKTIHPLSRSDQRIIIYGLMERKWKDLLKE
ncbi:hypothetical protein O181_129110 [Austropuccinia psidii MF-1]|uniref:Uncharacterized protein n=1 Tax=Austropuccinia psidii MF-1 TaxID=1389203 RepID=A0A9Q3KWI8_9BASI|nr:hypothetical protein [Austropuccinia psidii MF-1]